MNYATQHSVWRKKANGHNRYMRRLIREGTRTQPELRDSMLSDFNSGYFPNLRYGARDDRKGEVRHTMTITVSAAPGDWKMWECK